MSDLKRMFDSLTLGVLKLQQERDNMHKALQDVNAAYDKAEAKIIELTKQRDFLRKLLLEVAKNEKIEITYEIYNFEECQHDIPFGEEYCIICGKRWDE